MVPREPALQPNREFVEERYGMFKRAGWKVSLDFEGLPL